MSSCSVCDVFLFIVCFADHPDLHVLTHSLPTRCSADLMGKYRVQPKSYTSRHPSNHALRRIDMLKHILEHPLTSAETADFIGHLIEKYVTNQGKGFSWSLF